MIQINQSGGERVARVAVGVVLLSVLALYPLLGWTPLRAGAVGLIPFLTGLVGFCPIYRALRLSSRAPTGALAG